MADRGQTEFSVSALESAGLVELWVEESVSLVDKPKRVRVLLYPAEARAVGARASDRSAGGLDA